MIAPLSLIERTGQRLLRHQQINILSFFLPLAITAVVVGRTLLTAFSFSFLLVLIPLVLVGAFMGAALWRARKVGEREAAAALLDEKTEGQERFLTLATLTQKEKDMPLFSLVQRQAEGKAAAFAMTREVPFQLDRRGLLSLLASVLCILALLFVPLSPPTWLFLPQSEPEAMMADLEEIARTLLNQGKTPEEQVAGAQLLALAEELKNPALSPQEKDRLIEETEKRIKLNLPLPQLLPFDLKIFTSDSKKNEGKGGGESDQPQSNDQPLKGGKEGDQPKKSSNSTAGNEQQPGPGNKGEQKKDQSQPRDAGGGIKFDMPQQQQEGKKQERPGDKQSGQQDKSSQNPDQAQNSQTPGSDPNRPGGQQGQGNDPEKKGPNPNPQQPGQAEKGTGATAGHGPGERFLRPGEQPGGFLTKDARFVKVRVPVGQEAQDDNGGRTDNPNTTVPKTPYSNAPLKEGPPDQAQPKQPIPLEYRDILQK